MADDKRQKRMQEIAEELFEMANNLATEKEEDTGNAATFIHEAVNNIWKAQKCFDGEDIPIPMGSVMRSMGIDIEQMMKDIADINKIPGEENEVEAV